MVSAVELAKVAPSLKMLAHFAQKLSVRLRDLIPDEQAVRGALGSTETGGWATVRV
jgi:hypothetical protein